MAANSFPSRKSHWTVIGASAIFMSCTLVSCMPRSPSGPPSVEETSVKRPDLKDRVKFIEQYVKFRRSYKKLEYSVTYHNNGDGSVPGPSDWDIRLLAVIPPSEVKDWIPAKAAVTKKFPTWLREWSGSIRTTGMTEWYKAGGLEVGVDRATSTVAYRNTTL